MNRKQRRAQAQQPQVAMVATSDIVQPSQMTEAECREVALYRLGLNIIQTGHPQHHLTANGAIVDADPTLQYMLSRLPQEDSDVLREHYKARPDAKKAMPVNRRYYGADPYKLQA